MVARSLLNSGSSFKNIVIKSEAERIVYAEVYSPLHVDTDGEAMTAEEICKMAHHFLSEGRTKSIDIQHNRKACGAYVVESFIARKADPDGFVLGSWVLGVKLPEGEIWDKVLKGELNGFSFYGMVQKVPTRAEVIITRKMVGETEDSLDGVLPPHYHEVSLSFSTDGRLEEGKTGIALDHSHSIKRATATEMEWEHSHRLVLIDNE